MDRKEFFKRTFQGCVGCCGALAGLTAAVAGTTEERGLRADLEKRMLDGARTPDWRLKDDSFAWIRSMVENLDELVDEETRLKLLNACGRSCYVRAFGVADERPAPPDQTESFLKELERQGSKVERREGVAVIEFGYAGEQSPQGLSLREGFCLCPIVEWDPGTMSQSYCNCSAGYVKELIERQARCKVRRVEVLESIKRGGKDCRFRLELVTG